MAINNNTIEYKCPNCGGKVEFNSSLQQMQCPYCDSVFTIDEIENVQEDASQSQYSGENWSAGEGDFGLYRCSSCSAEIVADATTAATNCPYCGNPVILTDRLSGTLKPDIIIPFKLDKAAAKKALGEHLKGKRLLPKVFKDQNHLDEIKGVYIPFWLFDASADARGTYKATRLNHWSDAVYQYTETKSFNVTRSGTSEFRNVPVDALENLDNELTESLETFDCSEAVEFSPAYLSGYFADCCDVSAEDCLSRAKQRMSRSALSELRQTVSGYSSVETLNSGVNFRNLSEKYAMFPVWILNTSWNGSKYLFAMNGQTGKFVGNLPEDKKLSLLYRLLYGLGIGALLYFLGQFMGF